LVELVYPTRDTRTTSTYTVWLTLNSHLNWLSHILDNLIGWS